MSRRISGFKPTGFMHMGNYLGAIRPMVDGQSADESYIFLADMHAMTIEHRPADVHAVMVLDRAGWHVARALKVPANVTLVHLPPKSPELNPAENLWHYLRSHYWSNRLYKTWSDLKDAAIDGWRRVCLLPEKIKTVCADTALRGIQT